jgi:hypothetical protein
MLKVAQEGIGHGPVAEDARQDDGDPHEDKPMPPDNFLPALILEGKETHHTALH